MIRRDTSLLSLMPLRLAAATLFGIACSPTSGTPTGGTGGTGSTTGGFTSTTGGFATGGFTSTTGGFGNPTGGFTSTTGGVGSTTGGTTGTTGGTTGTTGGTTATTGGTTATTGGTTTSTGGTAGGTGTCAGYDGTVATASKIFMSGFGKATTGTWQGYAYTYTYGTGVVVKPGTSTTMSCFTGAQMCANGSVPADDGAGVGIGWNIAQPMAGTAAGVALTGPITVTIAGAKANMRVSLGAATGTDEYCHTLTDAEATMAATGLTIALADFKQYCYDASKAVAYAAQMIKAIQVAVPGSKADGAKTFDFCVVDVEPG